MTCLLLVAQNVEVFYSGLTNVISAANLSHLPLKTKGFGTGRVFRVQAVRAAPGVLPWSCSSSLGPSAAAAAPSRLLSAFSSSPGHEGLFKPLGLEGPPGVRGALEEREIFFPRCLRT